MQTVRVGVSDPRHHAAHFGGNSETRYFKVPNENNENAAGIPFLPLVGELPDGRRFSLAAAGFRPDGQPNAIRGVRLGSMTIPEAEVREFPLDAQGTHPQRAAMRYIEKSMQNWWVEYDGDNVPVLCRGIHSGDGMWPPNQTIAVMADWAEEAPVVEADAKAKK